MDRRERRAEEVRSGYEPELHCELFQIQHQHLLRRRDDGQDACVGHAPGAAHLNRADFEAPRAAPHCRPARRALSLELERAVFADGHAVQPAADGDTAQARHPTLDHYTPMKLSARFMAADQRHQ